MRRSAMGCSGDLNIRTPNIDRLAEEGVRFTNSCSVYPVCVPARFSLLTGEYPHTRQIRGIGWSMSPAERTIAHYLNESGYETCYIGKWHLNGGFAKGRNEIQKHLSTAFLPKRYRGGFLKWRGFELRNNHYDTYCQIDDNPEPYKLEGHQTDCLFDLSMKYIQKERDTSRPFFLFLSVEAPHPPFQVPEEYLESWKDREIKYTPNYKPKPKMSPNNFITYHAMIENLDYNIGRLVTLLETENLREDTLLIFTSDHGEMLGCHSLDGKTNPYEESVGVPLIFNHPGGNVLKGKVLDAPVSTIDLFPTILHMAGVVADAGADAGAGAGADASEGAGEGACAGADTHAGEGEDLGENADAKKDSVVTSSMPGLNLAPWINGKRNDDIPRKAILLESVASYSEIPCYFEGGWRAVRTRRYKYVAKGPSLNAQPSQLFDLENDPYEMVNLLDNPDYLDVQIEMDNILRTLIAEADDEYLITTIHIENML